MTNEMQKNYAAVLYDILENGPKFFQGTYDARNGEQAFMFGIATVMEHIALNASKEIYEEFSKLFSENMLKSEEKA